MLADCVGSGRHTAQSEQLKLLLVVNRLKVGLVRQDFHCFVPDYSGDFNLELKKKVLFFFFPLKELAILF